jgi:hypothetical protein
MSNESTVKAQRAIRPTSRRAAGEVEVEDLINLRASRVKRCPAGGALGTSNVARPKADRPCARSCPVRQFSNLRKARFSQWRTVRGKGDLAASGVGDVAGAEAAVAISRHSSSPGSPWHKMDCPLPARTEWSRQTKPDSRRIHRSLWIRSCAVQT